MKKILFLGFLLLIELLSPTRVKGLEGLSLVVSPLPINLTANPGSTVSAQLKIKNNGSEPEKLQVGLMKFMAFGEEGKPRLLDRDKGDDYFDWMTFSEDSFVINPNEWKTVTATINIPNNAAFGYYYAVTFSRQNEDEKNRVSDTQVIGATASLILLEVRVPNAIREIEVLEFSSPKAVFEFLPIEFKIKLRNKGNVHVVPRGDIFIDGVGKKDLAILPVNEVRGNVLPNSARVFSATWSDGFPVYEPKTEGDVVLTDRKGEVKNKLTWDFSKANKFRIGRFSANMLLVYDDGTRDIPIEGKLTFWVIPWRILAVTLVILGLLIYGLISVIKSVWKKMR